MAQPLDGKKIAILVESEFVPGEIAAYRDGFAALGATVEFMSRLWGQKSQTFVSDVENAGQTPETLTVTVDFDTVVLEEYAAVIMAANYTSVRLRYFETPKDKDGTLIPITPAMTRTAPAVRFFARAMRHSEIVKGALCHALWLLTPMPELLAGRRVICHEVVLADIVNAGAIYTPNPTNVVEDGDLITGRSWHEAAALVQRIKERIVDREAAPVPLAKVPPAASPARRRILALLSSYGYWGEELVGPLEVFDAAGYEVVFATPNGKRPIALPPSMDPDYVDPPLGRQVTSPDMARKVRELDGAGPGRSPQSTRLDNPLDLSKLLPERPYYSQPCLLRALEAYYRNREHALRAFDGFDALLIVGGSGPIVDLANNQRVHDLILGFVKADKPIAAECYGIACLAFARELDERKSILRNKHVTGHCLEHDYKDGTGFVGTSFNMGPPPYPLEFILRDATGPDGAYHGNFGKETSVIVDYPFVTGRSTADSYLTGQKLVEVLEHGLRRWGF